MTTEPGRNHLYAGASLFDQLFPDRLRPNRRLPCLWSSAFISLKRPMRSETTFCAKARPSADVQSGRVVVGRRVVVQGRVVVGRRVLKFVLCSKPLPESAP